MAPITRRERDDYINGCLNYLYHHQNLLNFVKDFAEPGGFQCSSNQYIYELDEVLNWHGYNCTAFAIHLRIIQIILQREYRNRGANQSAQDAAIHQRG